MGREHVIDPSVIHHQWDAGLAPALEIDSGDIVHYDLKVAGEGQVWPGASYEDTRFDFDTIYNLSGPVWVRGAEPGDTLAVDLLDLRHGDWGWAAFLPGFGLLPEDFPHGYVRTFALEDQVAEFAPGIRIPLAPFCGTIGTHPGGPGKISPFPPHHGCGNIDNRHLTAGSTLWVPVHVPGALFSCGDPHAAQGDGEVSVTALEAPLSGSMRITLHKRRIYMFVNLANLMYHARRYRESFNWFLNGFIPVAGIVIDGYILYKGFFVTELALPFKSGSSIVWISLAWALIGIIWAWWWSRRRSLASISLASEV